MGATSTRMRSRKGNRKLYGGRGAGRWGGTQVGEHTGFLRMRGLPFTSWKKEILISLRITTLWKKVFALRIDEAMGGRRGRGTLPSFAARMMQRKQWLCIGIPWGRGILSYSSVIRRNMEGHMKGHKLGSHRWKNRNLFYCQLRLYGRLNKDLICSVHIEFC